MERREFLAVLGGAALARPGMASADTLSRIYRLGTVTPIAPVAAESRGGKILIKVLDERGFKLGRNLTFEARGALGDVAMLPALIAELKAKNVDVVVIIGYPTAMAAKAAGIATVAASGVGDPVETRLIESLAHPGGQITGISDVAATLSAKRLSLLKEVSPKLTKVAMLWNKDDLGMTMRYQASAKAAQALGLTVQALGVREPDDFDEAFRR